MTFRPQPTTPNRSLQAVNKQLAERAHALKQCDECCRPADTAGGIVVKNKWVCAKCWVKFLNRK